MALKQYLTDFETNKVPLVTALGLGVVTVGCLVYYLRNSNQVDVEKSDGEDEVVQYVSPPTNVKGNGANSIGNPSPGSANSLTVDNLLRFTKRTVNYDPNPPKPRAVKIPVPHGWLFYNLLTPDECKQYISIAEEMGFEPSPLRHLGTVNSNEFARDDYTSSIRNSHRVLFDVPDQIGNVLNERLLPLLPDELDIDGVIWCKQVMNGGLAGCPLNKRWRFNKYWPGQYFKPHFDAGFIYNENEMTVLTFILYLNGGIEGGQTRFFPEGKKQLYSKPEPGIEFDVVPEAGKALVFLQTGRENPRHEGVPHSTEDQFKYILRSDVAYFRKDPIQKK